MKNNRSKIKAKNVMLSFVENIVNEDNMIEEGSKIAFISVNKEYLTDEGLLL